ncbi:hypothetical protein SAMN05444722_3729 [Rhodovulum sp. ES.010]|uniref:hypothetical protein n=1 Tax=Rhodovulum sp. ES.010 TaxID=1882821 RepID=UPI000929C92E|nr:hypothetical protein [Rhodovulum sp. ES.010]SIO57433.1 hypothetical protein SAMN05444722_3729 [Rhodovulum sp. ES.010]
MPFEFNIEDTSDPHSQLIRFLQQLEQLLQNMVLEQTVEGRPIHFVGNMRGYLREAYLEDTQPHFRILEGAVKDVEIEKLQRVGLTGASLRAKLAALVTLGQRVRDAIADALRYLLAQINSILGSISTATAGLADLISEFKDMLENCIDYVSGKN